MKQRLEDFVGKCLLVAIFTALATLQGASVLAMVKTEAEGLRIGLAIASQAASLLFVSLVIALTVTRLPPRESASGAGPRVTAIAGTFVLMAMTAFPLADMAPELQIFSMLLVILGTSLSILCLAWLGRSFSVMASARRLVVGGPYAIVRHPLYVAEAVSAFGIVLSRWSLAATMVGIIWIALQYRRALYEEAILSATFPEYQSYARRVSRFLPFKFFRPDYALDAEQNTSRP